MAELCLLPSLGPGFSVRRFHSNKRRENGAVPVRSLPWDWDELGMCCSSMDSSTYGVSRCQSKHGSNLTRHCSDPHGTVTLMSCMPRSLRSHFRRAELSVPQIKFQERCVEYRFSKGRKKFQRQPARSYSMPLAGDGNCWLFQERQYPPKVPVSLQSLHALSGRISRTLKQASMQMGGCSLCPTTV